MVESTAVEVTLISRPGIALDALATALELEPDLCIAVVATTGREGFRRAAELRPDVAVTDLELEDRAEASAAEVMQTESPATRVVVVGDRRAETLAHAIESGCSAFVLREQSLRELVAAIHRAAAGELVLPHSLPALPSVVTLRQRRGYDDLTEREREVLSLLARGASTSDIVDALVLSVHTIRNHVRSILRKLGVHSRVEAVAVALRLDGPRP